MRRHMIRPILVPALMVVLSVLSLNLAQTLQSGLENYRSRFIAGGQPGAQPTLGAPPLTRLTGRVILVVVDGLRDDTSRRMPFLDSLRRDGAYTTLLAGQPSFSKPGYAVLASGAWQEVNGVTLNTHRGPLQVDTLFARARAAGLTTAVIGDEWWGELIGTNVDYPYLYPDAAAYDSKTDDESFAQALSSLATDRADLTLIHFTWTDTEAHHSGGAMTPRYLAAARRVDDYLRRLAKGMDPSMDTLVITSDHGHLARNKGGGHGGGETEALEVPLVMYGKGVKAGHLEPGESVDVAPTVAALLGIPAPLETQGQILWDALWASDPARAAGEIALARQTARFAPAYVRGVSGRVRGGIASEISRAREVIEAASSRYAQERYSDAESSARATRLRLQRHLADLRSRTVWLARLKRIPVGIAGLLACILLLSTGGRRRSGPAVAAGLIFVGLDVALYRFVFSNPFSLGAFPDSTVLTLVRVIGVPAYLAAALVFLVYWLGRRRAWGGTPATDVSYATVGLYMPLLLVALGGLVWNGFTLDKLLPDFKVGFITLGALLQAGFLAPVAILSPVAAVLAASRRDTRGVDVDE